MQTCQGEFVQDLEARRALFLNQPPLEFFTSTATKSEYQEDEINLQNHQGPELTALLCLLLPMGSLISIRKVFKICEVKVFSPWLIKKDTRKEIWGKCMIMSTHDGQIARGSVTEGLRTTPGPTWQKERSDFYKLSSDLHTCTPHTQAHNHKHTCTHITTHTYSHKYTVNRYI